MKNIKLIILLIVPLFLYSQEENGILFFKLDKKVVYVDNSPATHFTMTIPGDSIQEIETPNSFLINNKVIQVLKRGYDSKDYNNKQPTSKEVELLKKAMKFEVDYFEDEIFNKELEVQEDIFLNASGKRFHLWWFKIPHIEIKGEPNSTKTEYTYYLNWVANDYISVMSSYSLEGEDFNDKIKEIKDIANSINVFGAPIDIEGTYQKMKTEQEGKTLEFVNPDKNFTIDIPKWANIVKTNLDTDWAITFPDIDNVKNVALVTWNSKEEFDSLEKFNEHFILNLKMGDKIGNATVLLKKELKPLDNCNGVAYKIQLMLGKTIYDCQYVTFETKSHYILTKFVATPETYDKNISKFEELVTNFTISD